MKKHKMKLNDDAFSLIKCGSKTIELRLYDEKRKLIKVNDIIEFENIKTNEKLLTKVINLYLYPSFEELYKHFDKISMGYKEEEVADASDMDVYYSKEKQAKYGVIGIEIKVLKDGGNMETVKNQKGIQKLNNNKIIGDISLENSSIEFKGQNNILFCNSHIKIVNSKLRFTGNNSLIFFDENNYPFSINIRVGTDSVFYLGKDCYLNKTSNMYATERKNILIGKECLLSFGCYFRTADPHLIYDVKTKKRLNFSKSIIIGDHVWIGQNSLILKNTFIGSGAIIGGSSVVSNKRIESNTIYAGNPARKIKDGVFYSSPMSTHDFDKFKEIESKIYDSDAYVYEKDETTQNLEKINNDLLNIELAADKIKYLLNNISNNDNKNRFYL